MTEPVASPATSAAADCSGVRCHACGVELKLDAFSMIPDSQKMTVALRTESEFVAAKSLGGLITSHAELLKAVAEDHGAKVEVFVCGLLQKEKSIEVEFLITRIK